MRPKVAAELPDRSDIEELLDLAVRAPSHHLTEPWRFYVLVGAERERLANPIAQAAIDAGAEPGAAGADAKKKVERAPVIVVFTRVPSENEEAVQSEDFASVAMAIENFLLGAHAKGLGAMLRTGPAAYHPAIRSELGLAADEEVVGFVYLGHPEGSRAPTPRKPAAELTTWFGWE